ncbi:MbtH family protein [Methylobacterium sp. JK268]
MTNETLWCVVEDREGRHSVWPREREIPVGWTATGYVGPREACLAHIDAVWTDLAPAGWRRTLAAGPEGVRHG